MEWFDDVAAKLGVKVRHDANSLLVLGGLDRNLELHGARYCPCILERLRTTICPCRKMRLLKECRCGLFERIENAGS